jgi:hypothetical protein
LSKSILFTGCSFTAGNGWTDLPADESIRIEVKDSPYLWTNLCCKEISKFHNLEIINNSFSGASNTEIFESTVSALANHGSNIDTVFCQWTVMPRYNFNVGFELWNTSESFLFDVRKHNVNLNNGTTWPREYISDLLNRLKTIHHLHWEILKVVKYSNYITKLSKLLGIQHVFFINGLCPWDKNYFVKLHNVKPESYTNFTKHEILNIDTRTDDDIYKLYALAHQHYSQAGGIEEHQWINLYDSFRKIRVDVNFDNQHPGPKSNKLYSQLITTKLQQLNFI